MSIRDAVERRRSYPRVTADAPTTEDLLPLIAAAATGPDADRLAAKPLRASLLLAVVAVHKESFKVHAWEQDAAAAGVAHLLALLLDDAGWGVMWRSGGHTRSAAVRRVHQLADNEELLGWLYVGGKTEDSKPDARQSIDPASFISSV